MPNSERLRRKRLIKEAEGYLDLIMVFDDRWSLETPYRQMLADRAMQTLEKIGGKSRRSKVLYLSGQAFRLTDQFEKAIDCLRQSALLDSQNIHTYLALGWCYKRIGQISLAVESLQSACELDPESGIIHYNLACYWSLAGQLELALTHLSNALEINPEFRGLVHEEPDFDTIRDDPSFMMITSVIV